MLGEIVLQPLAERFAGSGRIHGAKSSVDLNPDGACGPSASCSSTPRPLMDAAIRVAAGHLAQRLDVEMLRLAHVDVGEHDVLALDRELAVVQAVRPISDGRSRGRA